MNPENRRRLQERVVAAAEAALKARGWVSALDVLLGIGWLATSHVDLWRTGRLSPLERAVQANLSRISVAMSLFRAWASERSLVPSETAYVARTPARTALRFSRSGDPAIERAYRTHWVSPELSQKKRRGLEQKASRPPELVVIEPLRSGWACHRCGGTGDLLIMEPPGPSCLRCAGLDGLELLPAGDAALSRRAKAKSPVHAVVVRFSRSRKRYERRGLLVGRDALAEAKRELEHAGPRHDGRP